MDATKDDCMRRYIVRVTEDVVTLSCGHELNSRGWIYGDGRPAIPKVGNTKACLLCAKAEFDALSDVFEQTI